MYIEKKPINFYIEKKKSKNLKIEKKKNINLYIEKKKEIHLYFVNQSYSDNLPLYHEELRLWLQI